MAGLKRWAVALAIMFAPVAACAQEQGPDPDYRPQTARPAYAEQGPVILVDEAHGSAQTIEGRYAGFAALARSDGYQIRAGRQRFDAPGALDGVDILVISNPGLMVGGPNPSSFSVTEIREIEAWVRAGGSLLLAADHHPHGVAAQDLGRAFGVRMGTGYAFRLDPERSVTSRLIFSRDAGTLGSHPITSGRGPEEAIGVVRSFTGQSIAGPQGATVLLALRATDREAGNVATLETIEARLASGEDPEAVLEALSRPALPAQGLAFEHGLGRVVVLGEAGMLTAQRLSFPDGDDRPDFPFGLQTDGHDDEQFARNIFHWLSRLI